ncbi:hypothetical protein Afil01_35690 [Actinorhabdospora filicis]|uniref:Fluoroacetyl-CoA-specific thioesterase-like domain-containing protein n=1 Tax=Actinorhabdospora filicis TaxID=1785913 RepID=A0A9W6SMR7_9ACTN|nr:hotdog domain-containing protein [Actinorhabdospora filicis]GLZ78762.1 hypothetical protein Afil01_35690 [Actinorhabdospora filicis]
MDLVVGAESGVEALVAEGDLAHQLGSGDVPVLGTPRVLALMEAACVGVTAGRLPPGSTSVGVRVELSHVAAVGVGAHVTATARLEGVEGRRLRFSVRVSDGVSLLAEGVVERVVVDRERFVAGL